MVCLLDWYWSIRSLQSTVNYAWICFHRLAGSLFENHIRFKIHRAQLSLGKSSPCYSTVKILNVLNTAVNQTQVKSPSAMCPLGSCPHESSLTFQSEVRLSNSHQFYFSYQADYHIFCGWFFKKFLQWLLKTSTLRTLVNNVYISGSWLCFGL